MATARAHRVDPSVTRWYHCITRCVRRAFLLSEGPVNRQEWIELRLGELASIFAVAVGGFLAQQNYWSEPGRDQPRRWPQRGAGQ